MSKAVDDYQFNQSIQLLQLNSPGSSVWASWAFVTAVTDEVLSVCLNWMVLMTSPPEDVNSY
jgi:hypothetical protein